MTENKDKHAASSGDSTEIASSHNNNAQGQSTTAGGDSNNTKPKDKKNDSETTVALADTQHEGEKDKAPHDSHRIRRLTRLLTDKWATHHTQHTVAAVGSTADAAVMNVASPAGIGGMMAKINARHWLHPTSTHSTAHSPSVTPPTATPLATTPIMPLAASATGLFSPTTSATTPTPSIASSASSSSASATATTLPSATHLQQQLQQQQQQLLASEELRRNTFYRTVCASFQSAILLLDMDTGEISDYNERSEQLV